MIGHTHTCAPPISDYGYIGDCHSSALVSRDGSIDWCCMPRIDAPSCFGRILGWQVGGYCQIAPLEEYESFQEYVPDTMILTTIFKTKEGVVKLFDFMPMRRGGSHDPYQQVIRIVEGVKGTVELCLDVVPRFDYGAINPWLKPYKGNTHVALGGSHGLLISSDLVLDLEHHNSLKKIFKIEENSRHHLSLLYRSPEQLDDLVVEVPSVDELDFRLNETTLWWRTWLAQGKFKGPYAEYIKRSALVLKSLQTAPTGAIAAAATTSLPEELGGSRNWDYRFSWIRDSYYSVRSLARLGFVAEADGFRRFIQRSSHSSPSGLQTVFGVYGERRLHEYIIEELDGYHGSRPVRVGNEAATQLQLDMYGLLVDLAWSWYKKGISPDEHYWAYLKNIIHYSIIKWPIPDHGIWEMRGPQRHFVQSKMMCWVAVDRGLKMARNLGYTVPREVWKAERTKMRKEIEERGYDAKLGVFIQAYDYPYMDASLLLLAIFGFVRYNDPRFIRTMEAIQKELDVDGLLLRYNKNNDMLEGDDNAFLACTFWLVVCLAKLGRVSEAKEYYHRAIATSNDLYLFSEEFDINNKIMLGNFPQGFTHLSLIMAAIALYEADDELPRESKKY